MSASTSAASASTSPSQNTKTNPGIVIVTHTTTTYTSASLSAAMVESSSSASSSSSTDATSTPASSASGISSHRTLVITLSTTLSVGGLLVIGLVFFCWRRCRRGRLFPRGISPIDDDEIETWKGEREGVESAGENAACYGTNATNERAEKSGIAAVHSVPTTAQNQSRPRSFSIGAATTASATTFTTRPKRSLSKIVIDDRPLQVYPYTSGSPGSRGSRGSHTAYVYDAPAATPAGAVAAESWQQFRQEVERRSEDLSPRSARSLSLSHAQYQAYQPRGRFSLDQGRESESDLDGVRRHDIPLPAAVHARAPNSRPGLTDETIPGDPSFLPTPLYAQQSNPRAPRRQTSRLSKQAPAGRAGHRVSRSVGGNITASGTFGTSGTPGPSGPSGWHGRTRSARSSSSASGRSFGAVSEALPAVSMPPLPLQILSPRGSTATGAPSSTAPVPRLTPAPATSPTNQIQPHPKPHRRQSGGGSTSSISSGRSMFAYHHRARPGALSPGDPDADEGALLGGLSPPMPRRVEQGGIVQAIG